MKTPFSFRQKPLFLANVDGFAYTTTRLKIGRNKRFHTSDVCGKTEQCKAAGSEKEKSKVVSSKLSLITRLRD